MFSMHGLMFKSVAWRVIFTPRLSSSYPSPFHSTARWEHQEVMRQNWTRFVQFSTLWVARFSAL
jgi:hypothetical protein